MVTWMDNRVMDPNADFLKIIKLIEAVKNWRAIYHHITDTNAGLLDDIKLYKLPKGTATNLTLFYDWYEQLIHNMDKYT